MSYMKLKRIFYTFLDITGILLGIYLIILGFWVISGRQVSKFTGLATLILGIAAFFLHLGHYFNLGYILWLFGPDYFLNDKEKDNLQ